MTRHDFDAEGEPTRNVRYSLRVGAEGHERDIDDLMWHADTVAEIQYTFKAPTSVTLSRVEISIS